MKLTSPCLLLLLALAAPAARAQHASSLSALELPDAPQPAARVISRMDRINAILAWPGYKAVAYDHSRLGKIEKYVMVAERLTFGFDFGTTAAVIGPGSKLVERNPMNTLWGERNRMGILTSMTGWEMGYSYTSALIPRLPWPDRLRTPMKVATIILGGFLIEEHLRAGTCNLRLNGKPTLTSADNCMLF